jgi:hypothetical protein
MLQADNGKEFDFEEVTSRGGCGGFGLHRFSQNLRE